MRIKVEKLTNEPCYSFMPEKQRDFFTNPEYVTYENGEHYIWKYLKSRFSSIRIGFDKEGKLFIDPIIRAKTGKVSMTRDEIIGFFDLIIQFLSSAARNGFLELDELTEESE